MLFSPAARALLYLQHVRTRSKQGGLEVPTKVRMRTRLRIETVVATRGLFSELHVLPLTSRVHFKVVCVRAPLTVYISTCHNL